MQRVEEALLSTFDPSRRLPKLLLIQAQINWFKVLTDLTNNSLLDSVPIINQVGPMLRSFVVSCVLLCLSEGASAFMPAPRQSAVTIGRLGEQGVSSSRAGAVAFNRHVQVWAGEEEGEASGWDKAMVTLGFKKEAGESTRGWKDQLKSAGLAGVLSYVSSEVLFWVISLPLGVLAWHAQTGEWLDLSTGEGQAKVAGFSAGFLAFARLALPVRAAVALALTPAVEKYIVRPLIERGVIKE